MGVRHRTEREEVLRRAFALSWRDQVEVWQTLGSYLQPAGARETKVAKQLRERAEALDCMASAVEHLGLPERQAPTIEQYEKARAAVGLSLTRRQIEYRWEAWDFAKMHYAGERAVETAAQRSRRRRDTGRARTHEQYLMGVREWLEPPDPPTSTTTLDYNEWAVERNDQSPGRPVVRAQVVENQLALNWERVLRVAAYELDLREAHQEYLEEMTDASGRFRLVSTTGIAIVHAVARDHAAYLTKRPGFPRPAAVLGGRRVWYRSEVEAHREGRPVPPRTFDLQPLVMDSTEVCRRTGLRPDTLVAGLHRKARWVPPSVGVAGQRHIFLRDEFESWFATRSTRGADAKDPPEAV